MNNLELRLCRYGDLKRLIDEYNEDLRAQLCQKLSFLELAPRPHALDRPRVTGGKSTHADSVLQAVEEMVDVYDERIGRLRAELAEVYREHDDIQRMIRAAHLSPTEQSYLQTRYLDGRTAIQTAHYLGYSERQAVNIRRSLLGKLGRDEG